MYDLYVVKHSELWVKTLGSVYFAVNGKILLAKKYRRVYARMLIDLGLHARRILRKLADQYFAVNGKIDTSKTLSKICLKIVQKALKWPSRYANFQKNFGRVSYAPDPPRAFFLSQFASN